MILRTIFCFNAPMPEAEQLSALIADIYDTTLNAASWPQVLERICAFVPGCGSNLFSQDTLYSAAEVHYSWGDNPHYVQSYLNKYITMNPLFPAIAFGEVGRVGMQSDIISFEEFHRTRFYREWVQPQGYVDCLYCLLDKSETGCAMITVRRDVSNGRVDNEAYRRASLIVPHIRRAVLISRALEHSHAVTVNLTDLLDRMSAGIFLIGADGRVVYINAAGDALLVEGDVLAKRSDRLVATNPATNLALSCALAAAQQPHFEENVGGVAVPISGKASQQYVAHVLPLTSGLRQRIGKAHAAVAALFIRKANIGWSSPVETIAKLYKLTPSEIRILLGVVEYDGIASVASALGISQQTVRTHLKHIFEKTGKRRQAELIKLLAEFASPRL